MKRTVILLVCGLALALPAVAQAIPVATVTIGGVSGTHYTLTHGRGWAWPATGLGCTVTANVTGTQVLPPNDPVSSAVIDVVPASQMVNHNPVSLTLTDPTGQIRISSITSMSAQCNFRRDYLITHTTTANFAAIKQGGSQTYRTWSAYRPGGECTWIGDGSHGALSRCTNAHTSIKYKFFLPAGATFLSVAHTLASTSIPCRNPSWTLSHVGGTYSLVFQHGSNNGVSQCDIRSVTFDYHMTKKVTETGWMTTTAGTVWP